MSGTEFRPGEVQELENGFTFACAPVETVEFQRGDTAWEFKLKSTQHAFQLKGAVVVVTLRVQRNATDVPTAELLQQLRAVVEPQVNRTLLTVAAVQERAALKGRHLSWVDASELLDSGREALAAFDDWCRELGLPEQGGEE